MIVIINGCSLINGELVTPASGEICADEKTEAYLVRRGVAEYCGAVTAKVSVPAGEGKLNTDEMSTEELRRLCDERGIKYKKNATAKALRALLEDGGMPVLKAADPVDP